MANTPATPPMITNMVRPAVKPKVLGTLKATTKEKPHVDETDAQKKARKDRIVSRRKTSKR